MVSAKRRSKSFLFSTFCTKTASLKVLLNSYDIANVFEVSADCASNCARRCENWALYSGAYKQYENELRDYYKKVLEAG